MQVGPATGGKPTSLTHEVSFREIIRAIRAIVDVHVGDATPPRPPPPPPVPYVSTPRDGVLPAEATPHISGIRGTALFQPPAPARRYLQTGALDEYML